MKTTRLSQELQNMSDTEQHAMRRNQMGQNGSARDRLDPEWLRMKENGPRMGLECFSVAQNELEWASMGQNDPEWYRMKRMDPEWTRMVKNVLE